MEARQQIQVLGLFHHPLKQTLVHFINKKTLE